MAKLREWEVPMDLPPEERKEMGLDVESQLNWSARRNEPAD